METARRVTGRWSLRVKNCCAWKASAVLTLSRGVLAPGSRGVAAPGSRGDHGFAAGERLAGPALPGVLDALLARTEFVGVRGVCVRTSPVCVVMPRPMTLLDARCVAGASGSDGVLRPRERARRDARGHDSPRDRGRWRARRQRRGGCALRRLSHHASGEAPGDWGGKAHAPRRLAVGWPAVAADAALPCCVPAPEAFHRPVASALTRWRVATRRCARCTLFSTSATWPCSTISRTTST
jgi:hypothetical protein